MNFSFSPTAPHVYYSIYNNRCAMANDSSPERSSGGENPVPRRSSRLETARGAAAGRQGTRPAGRGAGRGGSSGARR